MMQQTDPMIAMVDSGYEVSRFNATNTRPPVPPFGAALGGSERIRGRLFLGSRVLLLSTFVVG
jgi:hypothetical protein